MAKYKKKVLNEVEYNGKKYEAGKYYELDRKYKNQLARLGAFDKKDENNVEQLNKENDGNI